MLGAREFTAAPEIIRLMSLIDAVFLIPLLALKRNPKMDNDDDPFACFDDDDDDDDESNASLTGKTRDPESGVLAFHAGTEQALLRYVCDAQSSSVENKNDRPSFVLNCIDEFCLNRHWMMHIGKEKAAIIKNFIHQRCEDWPDLDKPLLFVELGTYCGYSSIMITKTLKDLGRKFYFYSVEVVRENAQVAKELVRLAGFEKEIDILLLDPDNETLSSLLSRRISQDVSANSQIDFLFIDHDKSLYLSDLQQLEKSNLIQQGCFVAADNVVFAFIDDYREYIAKCSQAGILKSRLENTMLEYSEPDCGSDESKKNLMRDGIELSIYLKDPNSE